MSHSDKLKAILLNESFEQLETYKEPIVWKSLTSDDRELLGILFVKQGERQLKNGDQSVSDSFDLASKVAPNSPTVFYKQALVYAGQGQNIRCLLQAAKALEKAVELDPYYDAAWQSWGNILVRIGIFYDDAAYFIKADEKFKEAEKISLEVGFEPPAHLFWNWGVCWYRHGVHSGEAVDFFASLEKFRKAESKGLYSSRDQDCDFDRAKAPGFADRKSVHISNIDRLGAGKPRELSHGSKSNPGPGWSISQGEFYNDFGNVLSDVACLLGKDGFLVEAAGHYKKATELSPESYESWLNLACTCQRLYDFTGMRDYFSEADHSFAKAADLKSQEAALWLRWAELHVCSGKASHDLEKIYSSCEKFQRAEALEEKNPVILMHWGEAELLAGSYSENLELLKKAEAKILYALSNLPEQPEAWYIYGMCLSEFGRYFADPNYYLKAIEKFDHGLSLKGPHPLLLHGLALAFFALGELNGDVQSIEKTIAYCNQVADLGGRLYPQFLSDWGVALMKLGEMTNDRVHIEEAAGKFEQAISGKLDALERDDMELEWLYNYGCALDFLGDFHDESIYYEKSIQILSHVIKIDPTYTHARYNLGLAFSHLGELNSDVDCFSQALELFSQVVQYDPEDETAWNDYGLALIHLGVMTSDPTTSSETSRNYYERAESKLLQAVSLGSNQAFYNLACLYALTYNTSASLHFLERAEQSKALPPIDDVIHDIWLDNLRQQPAYRSFIARLLNGD